MACRDYYHYVFYNGEEKWYYVRQRKRKFLNGKRNVKSTGFSTSLKTVSWVSLGAQCGRNNEINLNDIYIFELS